MLMRMPRPDEAPPGREERVVPSAPHVVLGTQLDGPFGEHVELAMFGLGCFWGAERVFWAAEGVYVTAVGYAGGFTPNPTYDEVCSGRTGHAEVVRVAFDRTATSYDALLKLFWEAHDPTQGMRQGEDRGTQYRSVIFVYDDEQREAADATRELYEERIRPAGFGRITTRIRDAPELYFAEDEHQQLLAKNPAAYCGIAGTGVTCPIV